jgi:hypothetical protein
MKNLLLVIGVVLSVAQHAEACRCVIPDPFACAKDDIVLHVEVLSKIDTQCSEGGTIFNVFYPVRVLDVFKNATGDRIRRGGTYWAGTADNSAACGLVLEPGSTYVLYPSRVEGALGLHLDGGCLSSGLVATTCDSRIGPSPSAEDLSRVKAACAL